MRLVMNELLDYVQMSSTQEGKHTTPTEAPKGDSTGTVTKLLKSFSIVDTTVDAARMAKKSIQVIPPEATRITPVSRVPLAATQPSAPLDLHVPLENIETMTFKVGDIVKAKMKGLGDGLWTGVVVAPLSTVFEEADADHDGKLTFDEWKARLGRLMNEEDVRILFDACDTDKNGTLDREEFKRGLQGKYEIKWAQVLVVTKQLAKYRNSK